MSILQKTSLWRRFIKEIILGLLILSVIGYITFLQDPELEDGVFELTALSLNEKYAEYKFEIANSSEEWVEDISSNDQDFFLSMGYMNNTNKLVIYSPVLKKEINRIEMTGDTSR